MSGLREKIKRRFSHKEPEVNFDEHDSADEETTDYLNKEIEGAEKDNHPLGRPNTLLNRMLSHGNKKTEDEIAAAKAAHDAQLRQGGSGNANPMTTQTQTPTQNQIPQ